VARGEKIAQADPQNVGVKRNLMIGYSHLGDILGYPELPNLGDPDKAAAVYARMVEIGRQLHKADANDARAATDYAIALTRFAAVTREPGARIGTFGEALALIRRRQAAAPTNLTLSTYEALCELNLGDTFWAARAPGTAIEHWKRVLNIGNSHAGRVTEALSRIYTAAVGNLVRHLPVAELRQHAPEWLAQARAMTEKHAAATRQSGEIGPRLGVARIHGTQSIFHARLGNAAEAAAWRERALTAWRELYSHPGFVARFKKEVLEFEEWRP
jgi:tetratricopeptide (TPR) repeat protein